MFDSFIFQAILAGIGLSLLTGPLGSFVIWRQMAYFGDATAHAAILGVALALITDLPIGLGTLLVALVMATIIATLASRGWAIDTMLGVLSHTALALGLVAISFTPSVRNDLSSWLFGDILATSRQDLVLIWGGSLAVLALLIWRWKALLMATLDEDLAQASGISPTRERMVLVLALATAVALAIKVVGALLIAAMLIIPAAAARPLTRSPEGMATTATIIGSFAVIAGLGLSLWQDTPTGPSIISAAALFFAIALLYGRLFRHN